MGYGLPSKQTVNGVSGRLQARDVRAGCRLWALDGWRTVQTTVTAVEAVKAREVDSEGTVLAWTAARKLCRERLTVTPGYEFGYLLGANCSDGTVGKNYVSLVVNDEGFAARFAACLTAATGLPARLEAVTRPSGYLKRDVPGFRVRVVSSYLADLMRPPAPRACWSVPTWLSVRARPGGWGQVHAPEQGTRLSPRRGRQLAVTRVVQARAASLAARGIGLGGSARGTAARGRKHEAVHAVQLPPRPLPGLSRERAPRPPALVSRVRYVVGVAPAPLCSSSSGSLQTRSRKTAAAITPRLARTEKPA